MASPPFTVGQVLTSAQMNTVGEWKLGEFVATGSNGFPDFQSIPQNYRALKIIGSLKTTDASATNNFNLRFNADAGATNYITEEFYASGANPFGSNTGGTAQLLVGTIPGAAAAATRRGAFEILVPDYAATGLDIHAICSMVTAADTANWRNAGVWLGAVPVTRVQLGTGLLNAVSGSWAALYGIL